MIADATSAGGMVVYKDKLYFVDERQIRWVALTGGPVHILYTFNSTAYPQGMCLHEGDFGVPYLYIVEIEECKLWRYFSILSMNDNKHVYLELH